MSTISLNIFKDNTIINDFFFISRKIYNIYAFFLYEFICKIIAHSRIADPKPRASPLPAEVPCNYILGSFAAALQKVFVSAILLPRLF